MFNEIKDPQAGSRARTGVRVDFFHYHHGLPCPRPSHPPLCGTRSNAKPGEKWSLEAVRERINWTKCKGSGFQFWFFFELGKLLALFKGRFLSIKQLLSSKFCNKFQASLEWPNWHQIWNGKLYGNSGLKYNDRWKCAQFCPILSF